MKRKGREEGEKSLQCENTIPRIDMFGNRKEELKIRTRNFHHLWLVFESLMKNFEENMRGKETNISQNWNFELPKKHSIQTISVPMLVKYSLKLFR